jgi:RNA polymerase sigma-70 factor (ECF subfamily)
VEPSEEDDWVQKSRTGDRVAFAALVDRYWDPLRRWLIGLCGHEQLAEDVTQEAFFRAWTGLPQLQAAVAFRVWLFRIARNCLVDGRRGPRGAAPAALPEDLADRAAGPVADVLEEEASQQLGEALARLPLPYRAAYLLLTQNQFSYAHIAEVLGVSEQTARWRVCKARQFLLKELRAYLESADS